MSEDDKPKPKEPDEFVRLKSLAQRLMTPKVLIPAPDTPKLHREPRPAKKAAKRRKTQRS
ncbi:MAG: hypothetical protein ACLQGV_06420 [Bryobacteraceae bacterium]